MPNNRLLTMISSSIAETLRMVSAAASKGSAVFAEGLGKPVMDEWIQLEAEPATKAYIDLEAALEAVQSATLVYTGVEREVVNILEQWLAEHSQMSYAEYLERAYNSLSYSLATINQDPDLTARAHAGRAGSAQRQLNGIGKTSDELLACVAQYSSV
ncbi:TPA: hypothetical protein NIA45_004709 [Pseudomonas aeruginosa]|nr:hypothetical protein [Pseudomonas aeruginosa]